MKFTLSWLKKFLDSDASLAEILDALTAIGLEVESCDDPRDALKNFEVAQITKITKHPDAQKLNICIVQTKNDGELQIICGAPNVRESMKIILARIGAIVPNGQFKIKKSKIRGVESCGMICSANELNIGDDHDGILELDQDTKLGLPLCDYLELNDPVIQINVTPNRSDALGVYGIARDLAAYGIGKLKELNIPKFKPSFKSDYVIDVDNHESVPLFSVCEIRGVKNLSTPKWIKNFLEAINVGTHSAIVDITNYVLYCFGQPMHAYDAAFIDGSLKVTNFDSKIETTNKFKALDDKDYDLSDGDIIIKDNNKIHSIAGIIGGNDSACSNDTKNILLEIAVFNPKNIIKSGRRLMIDTYSRYCFERGIDADFALDVMYFATNLLIEICGGEASEIIVKKNEKYFDVTKSVKFAISSFHKKIGFKIAKTKISDILDSLGFKFDVIDDDNLNITIPSWRHDISIEEDIVEEIIRIYGYDNIPQININDLKLNNNEQVGNLAKSNNNYNSKANKKNNINLSEHYINMLKFKSYLASNGYNEILTWSFMNSKYVEYFCDSVDVDLQIKNPISSDLDYMRPSILPNILDAIRKNQGRSVSDIALFELGPVFNKNSNILHSSDKNNSETSNSELLKEELILTIARSGNISQHTYLSHKRYVDVYDIKTDLAKLLNIYNIDIDNLKLDTKNLPKYYHPTRSVGLYIGKKLICYFGELAPNLYDIFSLKSELPICFFELNISNLGVRKNRKKNENLILNNYPVVVRDYSFILDKKIAVGDVISTIKDSKHVLIKYVELVDIYEGDKIDKNSQAVTLSLGLQSSESTLKTEDIDQVTNHVLDLIYKSFNAKLREL